jgi:predicted transport protein
VQIIKEFEMNESIDPQLQTMLDNMPEKTGKSLKEWYDVLGSEKLEKHGDILKLLKGDYGVTHGYANTISILYRQKVSGGPPLEEDLIAQQYSGAKSALRPIYEAVLSVVTQFGSDVEIAPKKTYVSLRRTKQFAIVQAATKTRVDLGLNLKTVDPTERLEGGNVFSGMCTHRVRLASAKDVDGEVISWLKQAYDQA